MRVAELGERALSRIFAHLSGEQEATENLHTPELIVRGTSDLSAPR